jgi:predicted membrane-bound mannosyltransferase
MKNPFEKKDNTLLVVALFAGAAAIAGTVTYLYRTEKGAAALKSINNQLKEEGKDVAARIISGKTGIKKKTVRRVAKHTVN